MTGVRLSHRTVRLAERAVLGLVVVLLLLGSITPVTEYDIWMHRKSGELILQRGVPQTDWYSCTRAGAPWVYHEWLFAVVTHLLVQQAGLGALSLLNALLVTATLLVMLRHAWRAVPAAAPRLFLLLLYLLCGYLQMKSRFSVRPHWVSLLLLAVLLAWLQRGQRGWWPLLLFPLWANIHGDVLIGAALLGLHAVVMVASRGLRRSWRPLSFAVIAALLTLASPYGWRLWSMAAAIGSYTEYQRMIVEWMPLTGWRLFTFVAPYGMLLAAAAYAVRGQRHWLPLLLALLGLLAGLKARRYLPLAVVFGWPLYLAAARVWTVRLTRCRRVPAVLWLLAALALLLPFFRFGVQPGAGFTFADRMFPLAAIEYLQAHDLTGPVYATFAYGTLLTARHPHNPPYIDGRWDVHGQEHFARYLEVSWGNGWREEFAMYDIGLVLLKTQPFSFSEQANMPLAYDIAKDPDWGLAFFDDVSLVFVRRAQYPAAVCYTRPWPLLLPAVAAAEGDTCLREMERAVAESPYRSLARLMAGTVHQLRGADSDATHWFAAALREDPHNSRLLTELGSCYLRLGFGRLGEELLEQAALTDEENFVALTRLGERRGDAELLREALALRPAYGQARLALATLLLRDGQPAAALQEIRRGRRYGDDPQYDLLLGGMAQAQGEYRAAAVFLQRYLARSPEDRLAWRVLADCLVRSGRMTAALAIYEQEAPYSADAAFYSDLAALYIHAQRWRDAEVAARRALALQPGLGAAQRNLDIARHEGDTGAIRLD